MQSKARTPDQYIAELPAERSAPMEALRAVIKANLPEGFVEEMSYGMIGYVVPHELYPPGYHCDPKLPLPFISIASQKHFIGFYHMGIYADEKLHAWFVKEYPKHMRTKLDMGKSCVRFKKVDALPLELLGKLVKKMTAKRWIAIYESHHKKG